MVSIAICKHGKACKHSNKWLGMRAQAEVKNKVGGVKDSYSILILQSGSSTFKGYVTLHHVQFFQSSNFCI